MSFTFKEVPFGPITKHLLSSDHTGDTLEIVPAYGANLHTLSLSHSGKLYEIVCGANDFETFSKRQERFEGSKLCPWTCRLTGGKYTWEGKKYQLPVNDVNGNAAIHGLLYNRPFKLKGTKEASNSGTIEYFYQFEGVDGYPWSFDTSVRFTLGAKGLSCQTHIINTGKGVMPIGDGWHTYLSLGKNIDGLQLKMPEVEEVVLNNSLVPTGEFRTFDDFASLRPLESASLDASFRLKKTKGLAETFIFAPENGRTVRTWQEMGVKGYQYLIVYTPPERDIIAIEPMTCAPDVFNNGLGIISLGPSEEIKLTMGIELL